MTENRSMISRGRDGEGEIIKRHEKTFVGDGYVYYLGYGNDFLGVYICQNVLNYTLYIYEIIFSSILQNIF